MYGQTHCAGSSGLGGGGGGGPPDAATIPPLLPLLRPASIQSAAWKPCTTEIYLQFLCAHWLVWKRTRAAAHDRRRVVPSREVCHTRIFAPQRLPCCITDTYNSYCHALRAQNHRCIFSHYSSEYQSKIADALVPLAAASSSEDMSAAISSAVIACVVRYSQWAPEARSMHVVDDQRNKRQKHLPPPPKRLLRQLLAWGLRI